MRGSRCSTDDRIASRTGFTLVEVLVVVAIIGILTGIAYGLLGTAGTQARIVKTQTLFKRLDELVKARLEQIEESKTVVKAFTSKIDILDSMGNAVSTKAPEIVARKAAQRRAFPVRTSDLEGWDMSGTWDDSPVFTAGLTAISSDLECSEALFRALSPTGEPIEGIPSDMQVDSDSDGNLELVDAWGMPVRFYLWPTKLMGNSAAATALVTSKPSNGKDTADPYNLLSGLRYRLKTAMGSGTPLDASSLHDLGIYAPFLFVSAGPDRQLGLYEPWDSTNNGHLAAVKSGIDSASAADNISNRQGK